MCIENQIIRHCSPTLASLKTASLFNLDYKDFNEMLVGLESSSAKLNPKGVYIELLKIKNNRALIYVHRKKSLENDLNSDSVRNILEYYGYRDFSIGGSLNRLRKRLCESDEFPHEIGLFLGYPPGDVLGFIMNDGRNFKCVGCWKVYCDENESQKCFSKYNKCKSIYMRLFGEGRGIVSLTVAN